MEAGGGRHDQGLVPVLPHVVAVLVGAIDSAAGVSKFARDVRMDVQALVPVRTLREELAFLSGVVVLTLLVGEVAFGPVLAPDLTLKVHLFARLFAQRAWVAQHVRLLFLVLVARRGRDTLLNRAESLKSLLAEFVCLLLCHVLGLLDKRVVKEVGVLRGLV